MHGLAYVQMHACMGTMARATPKGGSGASLLGILQLLCDCSYTYLLPLTPDIWGESVQIAGVLHADPMQRPKAERACDNILLGA
jgi:hypothetical protein